MARRRTRKQITQEERLTEAYFALRKMCPSLTQYARTVTGKQVRVVPGEYTQTDGSLIEIRPPLDLADQAEHWRQVCGMRDTSGVMMCEACRIREGIMTRLHHEIAHISHGSFMKYGYKKIRELESHVSAHLPEYITVFRNFVYSLGTAKRTSINVAGSIHEHVAMIHLVCEDHRVNTASYVKEPALWKRMHDLSKDILDNGVEQDDGSFRKWQDCDLDQQVMIAPLFHMEGFELRGHFDDSVVDFINTDEVLELLDRMADHPTSLDNLKGSMILLRRMRNAGFMQKHSDPRNESSDNAERDEFMKALREILKALFGHAEKIEGGTGCDGDGDDTGSGGGEDDMDDGSIVRVISAIKYIEGVPGHLDGVNVFAPGQGPCSNGYYNSDIPKASEGVIGKAVAKSRIAFNMNARAKVHRDQKSGRVDARNLGKRAWNSADDRLFKHKTVPDSRDYEVLIGFDISGSTSSGYGGVSRLEMLKFSVCALADTMNRLGVKFSIYAHNTGSGVSKDYYATCGASMDIYQLKTADEKWLPPIRERIASVRSGGSNLDGNTLRYYRLQLDKSKATDKILMYFTDGVMPGMSYDDELVVLKDEIRECHKRGYTLLGVGVFTDAPKDHGLPTVEVSSEADYPAVIDHLAKRLMR